MPYKIISKIASGTFGTVYKVQESTNGEFFALKLIHENYKTPNELKRIKRGFETAQKVSHPNCVKMVEWYEKGNDIGFVMEFVEMKEDLTGLQKPVRSGNLTDKISKIIQIANGLEALHSRGIVHRDLKPANILETVSGQIKITDFDLVKLDDSSTLTASGAFLGTAKYSSPEQCQNAAKIDFRSDLYSLGVLFYQLVCGRVPFDGDSLAEIALAHIRTPLISPKQFVPDLSEVLNTVISKLLKKNPKDRFQSAQEVSKILSTFLKEGKVENLETFGDFLLTPGFVGRRKEFTELNKIFSETSNKLKTVFISGEQGVGKTKLWKEFRLGLPQKTTLVFETKCRQNGNTFEPLQTILSKALEQIENLSSKEQAEKIGRFGRDLSKILPQLENKLFYKHLLEVPTLEGSDSELRLFEAFVDFLQNIQQENQTFVFFFDDLQWIDEQSFKFLGYLTRNLSESSILVVGTVLKDLTGFRKPIRSELEAEILEIENFTLEEVREFLTKMFGKADPVNTRFCEEILKRTGGNVLFVQELMYHLLETKKLNKSEGEWDLGEESFSELKLPKSIQSVVGERLNFLEKDLLKLLEVGSLLGKYFTSKVVAEVLSSEEKEIESKLTSPSFEGILEKNETSIFEFVNDSFRESVSSSIKPTAKKNLHKKITFYLERNFEETEVLEELAYHYFEAGVKKKALEFCLKAGEMTDKNQFLTKSLDYSLKANTLLGKSSSKEALELKLLIAKKYHNLNQLDNSIKLYSELSNETKFSVNLKALTKLGNVYFAKTDFPNAVSAAEKAIRLGEKDVDLLAKNFELLGKIYWDKGNLQEAKKYFQKVLNLKEKLSSKKLVNKVYNHLGNIAAYKEEWENAEKNLKANLNYQNEFGNALTKVEANFNFGNYLMRKRELKEAKSYFELSLKLSKEVGYPKGISVSYGGLGSVYYLQGDYEKSANSYNERLKLAYKFNDIIEEIDSSIQLAGNFSTLGKYEESEKLFSKTLPKCIKTEQNFVTSMLLNVYADMLIESENYTKALEIIEQAIPYLKGVNWSSKLLEMHRNESIAFYNFGKFREAFEACEKAENYIDKIDKNNFPFKLLKLQKLIVEYELEDKNAILNKLLDFKELENETDILSEINFEFCKLYSKNNLPFLINEKIDIEKFRIEAINGFKEMYKSKPKYITKKNIEFLESLNFKTKEIYPELISSLTNWINPETVFDEMLNFLQKETNANNCLLVLENKENYEISAFSSNLRNDEIEFSTTVLNKAISQNKATLLKNVLEVPELNKNESVISKIFLSVIAVPIEAENKIIGALYLDRTNIEKGFFTNSDLEKVITIASILSPVLKRQNETMKMKIDSEIRQLGIFIGNSPKMRQVFSQIEKIAKVNLPVYIFGESGTGKELVAKALHKLSLNKNNPFIAVNCSAIPKDLAESELFGHEKGSFSGAVSMQKGKFELAENGTIFLDEIAELPLSLQAKLLRVIQELEFWRVGGNKKIDLRARIICATNKDLLQEVKNGNFREDLYFRLNILKIDLPPLRERNDDIHILAVHFLNKYSSMLKRENLSFSKDAIIGMLSHKWNGNVRELENAIAKVVVSHTGNEPIKLSEILPNENISLNESSAKLQSNSEEVVPDSLEMFKPEEKLSEKIERFTNAIIKESLKRNNGNKSQTAKELGISRKRLTSFNLSE